MTKGMIIAAFMLAVTSALAEKVAPEKDVRNVISEPSDVTQPKIAINSPIDGTVVESLSVLVKGTVSAGTEWVGVTVNGETADVKDNSFKAKVTLTKGSSTLKTVATDTSGNTAIASVKVKIRLYGFRSNTELTRDTKCSNIDYRIIHGCVEAMFFQPTARVYFDTGGDDEDEVDLFRDGSLNPTIDFAAIYWPWRLGYSKHFDDWSWGPLLGAGISAPAKDSDDGTENASNSPVVVFSTGLLLNYYLSGGSSFGFEGGRAWGFTTDESFGDKNDNAWYVGLKISIPTSRQKVFNSNKESN